jgi:Leucine-rich repeat (LRR) protein
MKMDIKKRIENRREKEERTLMQKEEHYCLEIEKQRKFILEEERRKAEKLLALENQRMMTEEMEMRKFLDEERREAIRRQKEQEEEMERKEKELLAQKLREEQERAEADALAERLRKEREDQIRQEQLRLEQAQREEEREKELKHREKQKKNEKEKSSKARDSTSKDRVVTGSLTARKGGVFGWGGAIEEPKAIFCEDESKNSLNVGVNRVDHSDTTTHSSDQTPHSPENLTITESSLKDSSNSSTDIVGPIVSLSLCDDISALHRITSIVQSGIASTKEPMKYFATDSFELNQPQPERKENLPPHLLLDSILENSLATWKQWKHQLHLLDLQPNPHHHVTNTRTSHRQAQQTHHSTTTELKMSVENLQNLEFLGAYPSLISLECNVNQITSLVEMSPCSCSTSLTDLSLNDNQLTSLHGLEFFHSLHSLYLDVNQLNDLSPIQHLPQLVTLSVKMNRLETFPSLHTPTLQKLDLYHNRISTISTHSLQSLSSLTHLDLGRNKLMTIDGHILSHCQLLSHLILSQNQLSHLPAPLYLPNLRSLWLSKNTIHSLDSWIGQPIPHSLTSSSSSSTPWPVFLPLLERLYLQDNEISSVPKYSFVTSPLLSELDLSFNNLQDGNSTDGILFSCQLLKKLQLQENPLLYSSTSSSTPATAAAAAANHQNSITQIQNALTHLVEFCGHAIDVKKGVYAPPSLFTSPASLTPPLTVTEMATQKQILTKQRCDMIRHLKRNSWRGNVSEIFRVPLTSKPNIDLMELEPIHHNHHHPLGDQSSAGYQQWKHFLLSLLAEQNIFKTHERISMKTSTGQQHHQPQQQSVRGTSSFVELLRNHCQLIFDWDKDPFLIPRVVLVSPSSPLLLLPSPTEDTLPPSVEATVTRKDTKEFHAVIRARQTHAALAIQSLWRGHFTRKRLDHLLSHAKYYDADLEQLMDAHNLTDYLGILNETLPELSDDWLLQKLDPNEDDVANSETMMTTMVYGDHRRKKIHSPRSESSSTSISHQQQHHHHRIPITPERTNDMMRSPRGQLDATRIRSTSRITGEWVVDEKKAEILQKSGVYLNRISSAPRNADPKIHDHLRGEEEWENDELGHQLFPSIISHPAGSTSELSRPASSSSTISGSHATPLSTTSSQRFGKGEYHGDNEDIDMLLHTGRTRISSTSSSLADQWEASSRPAVQNVLKRTKFSKYVAISSLLPSASLPLLPLFSHSSQCASQRGRKRSSVTLREVQ